ncbi:MAG TPA: hypothetical protein EYP74_01640 [Anaerolineales bacterium]|nr:hypothetical protein [Anaerolineales bacterium]
MPSANLNISIVEKRILTLTEAASYSGLPVKYFKATCPTAPVELRVGVLCWDKRDLDQWIDSAKSEGAITTRKTILEKL